MALSLVRNSPHGTKMDAMALALYPLNSSSIVPVDIWLQLISSASGAPPWNNYSDQEKQCLIPEIGKMSTAIKSEGLKIAEGWFPERGTTWEGRGKYIINCSYKWLYTINRIISPGVYCTTNVILCDIILIYFPLSGLWKKISINVYVENIVLTDLSISSHI